MKSYGKAVHVPVKLTTEGRERKAMWTIETMPHVRVRLKRVFAQIKEDPKDGKLYMSDTPETCKELLWALGRWNMTMDTRDRSYLERRARKYDDAQAVIEDILAGGVLTFQPSGFQPVLEPRVYQLQGSDIVLAQKRLIILDEVGLGKTLTALLTLREEAALPLLVVCQSHLRTQWQKELTKFFPMVTSHIIDKGSVYPISKRRHMHGHSPFVLIISYDMLKGWASHLSGLVRTVVFDEVQELRRTGTFKYEAATQVSHAAEYAIGTTATLVYNYGGEAHTIVEVVKPDALGTRSEFIQEWGHQGSNDKIIVSDPDALGTYLRDEMIVLRRTRKEVGRELPETMKIEQVIEGDEDRFDEMMADLDGLSLAEQILSKSGTSLELRNARGDLDWKMRMATGIAKAPYVAAFVDLLLESEAKVLVGVWHREVYDVLMEALADYNPVMYSGSENSTKKDKNAAKFMKLMDPEHPEDECRVMFMSLKSGAGLNGLQEVCKVCVFAELDWAPPTHDQFSGRLRRDGMDEQEPVLAFYLNCNFGSDPVVLETLAIKKGQSDGIHDPGQESVVQIDPEMLKTRVDRLAKAAVERKRARLAA